MAREVKFPRLVQLRLPQDLAKAVDDWRRTEDDIPSRSEAMRRLIEKGLGKA